MPSEKAQSLCRDIIHRVRVFKETNEVYPVSKLAEYIDPHLHAGRCGGCLHIRPYYDTGEHFCRRWPGDPGVPIDGFCHAFRAKGER